MQISLRGQKFGHDVRRILHLLSRAEKPMIEGVKARVLVPKICAVEEVFDPSATSRSSGPRPTDMSALTCLPLGCTAPSW